MKKYSTLFVKSINGMKDEQELHKTLQFHTEDGSILHSVIPRIDEGTTEGYMLVFEDPIEEEA